MRAVLPACCVLLPGCGACTDAPRRLLRQSLRPRPGRRAAPAEDASGPGPSALERALIERYGSRDDERAVCGARYLEGVRYMEGRADLDGDGRAEVVAHVVGPLTCGSGGCVTLVFAPAGDGLRLVPETTVSRAPVVALPERSCGWRDLALTKGGAGGRPGSPASASTARPTPATRPFRLRSRSKATS